MLDKAEHTEVAHSPAMRNSRLERELKSWSRQPRTSRGFTMTELVVGLAIILITTAISIPALITAWKDYRLSWQATTLSSLIQQGRYTAVKRNTTINVCAITQGPQMAVFVDLNGACAFGPRDPMVLLPVDLPLLPAGTAPGPGSTGYPLAVAVRPGGAVTFLSFNSRGTVSSGGAATVYIFYLGNPNRPDWGYRAVTVTPMGQVKPWSADNGSTWHTL